MNVPSPNRIPSPIFSLFRSNSSNPPPPMQQLTKYQFIQQVISKMGLSNSSDLRNIEKKLSEVIREIVYIDPKSDPKRIENQMKKILDSTKEIFNPTTEQVKFLKHALNERLISKYFKFDDLIKAKSPQISNQLNEKTIRKINDILEDAEHEIEIASGEADQIVLTGMQEKAVKDISAQTLKRIVTVVKAETMIMGAEKDYALTLISKLIKSLKDAFDDASSRLIEAGFPKVTIDQSLESAPITTRVQRDATLPAGYKVYLEKEMGVLLKDFTVSADEKTSINRLLFDYKDKFLTNLSSPSKSGMTVNLLDQLKNTLIITLQSAIGREDEAFVDEMKGRLDAIASSWTDEIK